jgi:hypothetical protein
MTPISRNRDLREILRARICGSTSLRIDHLGEVFKEACMLSGTQEISTRYREFDTLEPYAESDIFVGIKPPVQFDDSEIDLLVALSQPGYEKNESYIRRYGHLIVDRGNVVYRKTDFYTISGIPAMDITRGKTGKSNSAGFALMGHLAYIIDSISRTAMLESIRSFHPGDKGKPILEIFEIGYSISSI